MNRMPGSPIPDDSTSASESDALRPAQRRLLRSLLVEHAREDLRRAPARASRRRLAAAASGFAAVAGVAAIAAAVVVSGVPLLPGGGSPAGPGPVTVAPTRTADPVESSAPTTPLSPTPTTPADEQGTGSGAGAGATLTAQTAYDLCLAAPDPWDADRTTPDGTLIPAAPTTSTATLAASQVAEYVPGTWTVVIPVQRAHTDRDPEGIKVCTVSGPADDPAVAVTDALD